MAGTVLLDRIATRSSARGPILAPLAQILTPLSRSFWAAGILVSHERAAPDSCLVLGSGQVSAYRLGESREWARYADIRSAFEARNQARTQKGGTGAKTSPLDPELVDADLKLLIRDRDNPVEAAVVWERVYPKRAWVGVLHPSQSHEMAFVLAALLNSALGQALYRRSSRTRPAGSHDLRKAWLDGILVPILGYDNETFSRVALTSYRLHGLYAAAAETHVPDEIHDSVIPGHWKALLSDLARLYGYDEPEARRLIERELRADLQDLPEMQSSLFYVSSESLGPIRLLSRQDDERYEALKALSRRGELSPSGADDLEDLRRRIAWEVRLDGSMPTELKPTRWPGITSERDAIRAALRHLAMHRGTRFGAETPRRISPRLWEVQTYHVPPGGGARKSAGPLVIDAVTGIVQESESEPPNAAAPGS